MVSKFENKTVEELKEICRQKNITGYSKLKKEDVIKLVKKNSKKKNVKVKKSKKGGANNNNNKLIRTDEDIKKAVNDWLTDKKAATKLYGDISNWDTSNVTNMNYLFSINVDTKNIKINYFNDDISKWHVSNVKNMEGMFAGAIEFNQDLNNWNTTNVNNMESMFQKARSFNGDISNWNVSNVENMKCMFNGAVHFNQDLNNWNTSKVNDMVDMFQEAGSFNGNISNWDVSNVKTMGAMFKGAYEFNQPLNDWDVSRVNVMGQMFRDATEFNQDLNSWDVSNVISMALMFNNAESFNGKISDWKVPKVIFMQNMFEWAGSFNQPIGEWNFSTVKNMESMFDGATSFNQPIGEWNVSTVKNMESMFAGSTTFNQPIGNWDVSQVTNMKGMFFGATSFNQSIGDWNVSKVTNMEGMFTGASSFNQNISNWEAQDNITSHHIFENCPISMEYIPQIIRAQIIRSRFRSRLPNSPLFIKKNMLNTSKNTEKYHNHKLYNHILTIDNNTLMDENIHFEFEGQTGINAGGLTRTVYDIFYHSYIKKFFEVNSNGSYYINKTKINDNNKENIITATYKLIILAKKGSVQIVIPIHETLMEILKSENPTNTINLTNKNKYNDSNTLTNTTRKYNENTKNSKISNVIAINNGNTTFNINWNNIKNNDTKENTKKEIFLRRYLNSMGFKKYTDFEYMHTWFKKCWKDDIFITKLSFTKKDFFKRIKITKLQDGNKPRQEYNLSPNNNSSNLINKFINSNNGKQLIQEYPNLKVVLDYINQEDDECRKKFNKYMTGSVYSNGKMTLLLVNGNNSKKPIHVHTCFNRLDIYKINQNQGLKNYTTLTKNRFNSEEFITDSSMSY